MSAHPNEAATLLSDIAHPSSSRRSGEPPNRGQALDTGRPAPLALLQSQ